MKIDRKEGAVQRGISLPALQRLLGHDDLASIGHAGIFAVLLIVFPIQAVYVTLGLVMFGLTWLATRINRRL